MNADDAVSAPGGAAVRGGPAGVADPVLPPEHREDVRVLLAHGRRVNAIRLYRDLTGACLADASAAVDRLA